MARNWTEAQRAAIETQNADILVSAAAGSGKTAVLVERIIQKITNSQKPVDIDRLLVVTFTNAAAAEMRQRIGEALTEQLDSHPDDENLHKQLALLQTASITTIHGFCHGLLRENFAFLGLDPTFKIADTTENDLLRLEALEEVIEELYEDPMHADAFLQLTEAYMQVKNPDGFYELVQSLFHFVMSLPNPAEWLEESAKRFMVEDDTDFNETTLAKELVSCAKDTIQAVVLKYDAMISLLDNDDGQEAFMLHLQQEKRNFEALLAAKNYEEFYRMMAAISFDKIPSNPKDASPKYRKLVQDKRDKIKSREIKRLKTEFFALSTEEQLLMLNKLAPLMRVLSETVRRLMERFACKKRNKNLLDFNDLEHACFTLLVDDNGQQTELAAAVRQQYDEILIDEYQDTSALQEAIFHAIKKEKSLFMVGDIKQSIYRFRNTNPLLFQEKKERFKTEKGAPEQKIILSNNFRSRASVLDGINYIFSRIMSPTAGEIEYNDEEKLYPGFPYPEMEKPLSEFVEICLVDLKRGGSEEEDVEESEEEVLETAEAEALMAADKIESLIKEGYEVLAGGKTRKIQYRDICILLRSTKSTAECYTKVLSSRGIPCYSDAGGTFLESEEINLVMSLLRIIDNPHQDIPLLAVLRSQLYALSADELAEIRLADRWADFYTALTKRAEKEDELGNKLKNFINTLEIYRKKSRQLSMSELVWHLYMQTGLYEAQATMPGGHLRRLNLRLLYLRAAGFEKTGLRGLYSFIRFVDEYASIGGDYDAARTVGEEQNVVRIMSIHKSKGLEFPVVFVGGLARRFNLQDLKEKVLIHNKLGYGPQYIDGELGLTYESPARALVKQVLKQENYSEEERILYVALTRAREKLFMLAAGTDLQKQLSKHVLVPPSGNIPGMLVLEASSYLDWIFMALLSHPDAKALRDRLEFDAKEDIAAVGRFLISFMQAEDLLCVPAEHEQEGTEQNEVKREALLSLLEGSYAHQAQTNLPAKISVTELKRKFNEEDGESLYLYKKPAFLKRKTGTLQGAEAGTAMHTFLEYLDYKKTDSETDISMQLGELVSVGTLTQEEADAISPALVYGFMESVIGERLKKAKEVKREVSFAYHVDAEPIFGISGEVMLQGIIDCVIFEEDGISVLDYKTDRVHDEEKIKKQYSVQLDCYRKAAERIYKLPVKHTYLYLFDKEKLLEI